MARREVPFPLGIVYYGRMVGAARYARSIGATWACPNYHFVDREVVDEMHAEGVKVVPWTANRARDWSRLRDVVPRSVERQRRRRSLLCLTHI